MSIVKISDTSFKIDVRVKVQGREYRRRETYQGGKKQAIEREIEIRKELKSALQTSSLKVKTFGDALKFYREHRELGRSGCLIDRLISDLGNCKFSDLADRFDLWSQSLKNDYSVATLNRYLAWSKAALNLSVLHGYIKSNPLKHLKKTREIPRDRLLTEDEKARLLDVILKTPTIKHIYWLVKYSLSVPCRKTEMVSMRREWYDHFSNTIIIPGEYTKAKKPVVKPVPPDMVDYMRTVPAGSEFIFYRKLHGSREDRSGEYERYVTIGDFKNALNTALADAEITNFHFHDTRRLAYTDLILAGNLPHIVQKVSGHATDMSKVYLNIQNMQAAKLVKFGTTETKKEEMEAIQ